MDDAARIAQLEAELQESDRALTLALEQQTALADVLRAIAASPTDLDGVLGRVTEGVAFAQAPGWRSGVYGPLRSGQDVIGVLNLLSPDVNAFDPRQIQLLEAFADQAVIMLVVERPNDIGEMRADLTKVRQTLFNLLSNATRFTEHGTISLSVEREPDDWMTFAVADTGIGMTEEQLGRLFEAFSQPRPPPGANTAGRPGPRDLPPLLPHDGRRPDRRERLRAGLDVHRPAVTQVAEQEPSTP